MTITLIPNGEHMQLMLPSGKIFTFALDRRGYLKCNGLPLQLALEMLQERTDLIKHVVSEPINQLPDKPYKEVNPLDFTH